MPHHPCCDAIECVSPIMRSHSFHSTRVKSFVCDGHSPVIPQMRDSTDASFLIISDHAYPTCIVIG
jgi:hypothetical protein